MSNDQTAAVLREFGLDDPYASPSRDELEKIAAALAEAREDTKRLDWLEANASYYGLRLLCLGGPAFVVTSIDRDIDGKGDTLRAALDHASGGVGNG